ncbi:MAG: hydroxymethylglutaryl-CoA reductase, degradative [Gammaproteobacteria bacterium]|nr:hydroxymethylglutaryl-CoA reductase, degradative [Gammaproteobacteria bacterium]
MKPAIEEGIASSRIPNFFNLSVKGRIQALRDRTSLTESDLVALDNGSHTLKRHAADKMIENVVGVFGLPLGVGLNFLVDDREVIVPLTVEEPSIVAGLSGAARTARLSGGFRTQVTDPILIGQVQVVNVKDIERAQQALHQHRDEIVELANRVHPNMLNRGGGAIGIEVFHHRAPEGGAEGAPKRDMIVVHLLVDTRDAMGANIVNGMCEGIASLVEEITGGSVFLRILSNLTDRSLVRASVEIPVCNLEMKGFSGKEVRDGIVLANDLALVDPYRATTHNKGIMNGVDAVAIATGNDFRAIEAAAHAYAARSGRYRGLTSWYVKTNGDLKGEIEMPMKVGTVGASLESNPTVKLNHRLLGHPNASELASVMGAVGLAQNYAALRSLVTAGIQKNHMSLHARSVASAADVPQELFDWVVENLVESGEIKVWKAKELVAQRTQNNRPTVRAATSAWQSACGKAILLGEHAVVYGRWAFAVPLPVHIKSRITDTKNGIRLQIPQWGIEQQLQSDDGHSTDITRMLEVLLERLELRNQPMMIEVSPSIPPAQGLGSSAAIAVSIVRALNDRFKLSLDDEQINECAFDVERIAHGTASGIDNTVVTLGCPILFRGATQDTHRVFEPVRLTQTLPLVIAFSGEASHTSTMVDVVAKARSKRPARYERILDQLSSLAQEGADAAREGALDDLGETMNLSQGYLNALGVSTRALEEIIEIARSRGASGAKLTGGGGGGAAVILCSEGTEEVASAINTAGYETMEFEVAPHISE